MEIKSQIIYKLIKKSPIKLHSKSNMTMNIQLYKTCPHPFCLGLLNGGYCDQPVEANQIYCTIHNRSYQYNILNYNKIDNSYLDPHSEFVFTYYDGIITILGVATSNNLIPLTQKQIQFAEARGWFVDDGLDVSVCDIKEPGFE
jgi:hypothetical protein